MRPSSLVDPERVEPFNPFRHMGGVTRFEVAAVGAIVHRFGMTFDPGPIRRPNPLAPLAMTPAERRTELCGLLALGLLRLQIKNDNKISDSAGESCLHYPPDQCRHATPTHRRNP